jgi:hypothetical protein
MHVAKLCALKKSDPRGYIGSSHVELPTIRRGRPPSGGFGVQPAEPAFNLKARLLHQPPAMAAADAVFGFPLGPSEKIS